MTAYRTLPPAPEPIQFYITPACLVVPWAEATRILGHDWCETMTTEDDDKLRAAVLAAPNAPAWAAWVGGWPGDEGWCLQTPAKPRRR